MTVSKEAPHQFAEIDMNLFSNIDYESLLTISYFSKANGTIKKYSKLSDALRKYQWFVIAHLRAQAIEKELLKIKIQSNILMDPIAQSEFSKSVYEMIIYGKAALDSLSQFFSDFFDLKEKSQNCDFKWEAFREKFEKKNFCPGLMADLEYWLTKESELTNSISSSRDHWIHQEYITVPLLCPPNDIGCLVIPKLIRKYNIVDDDFSSSNYYSIDQFVNIHHNNLARLISSIITSAAAIESDGRKANFPDKHMENRSSFFPCGITEHRIWKGVLIGPFTYGANQGKPTDN
ncbi:MAG: hypothetical protein P1U54_04000 [Immundisolibacteraceae bacterium]|nr:hypothetical protein [Immundisolibacteraceae bacterium]